VNATKVGVVVGIGLDTRKRSWFGRGEMGDNSRGKQVVLPSGGGDNNNNGKHDLYVRGK